MVVKAEAMAKIIVGRPGADSSGKDDTLVGNAAKKTVEIVRAVAGFNQVQEPGIDIIYPDDAAIRFREGWWNERLGPSAPAT